MEYIFIPSGIERINYTTGKVDRLKDGLWVFARRENTWEYKNIYGLYSIRIEDAYTLPVSRVYAQLHGESDIINCIDSNPFQQVILNTPQEARNIPFDPYLDCNEIGERFPNLIWALKQALILSNGEAQSCIQSYRGGFNFGCEAVSHSGGTPLDAIVRSVVSLGFLVAPYPTKLGEQIINSVWSYETGGLNLKKLEKWCKLMVEMHTEDGGFHAK